MKSNALRKQDYLQDYATLPAAPVEIDTRQIAAIAEAASRLSANICGPDLEEFTLQYGLLGSSFV